MEKLKNITIALMEIILVIVVVLLVIVYISTDSTEKKYKKVTNLIKTKNYTQASTLLKEIPNYKNVSELEKYIYPASIYYASYDAENIRVAEYRKADAYINKLLVNKEIKKYNKELISLRNALEFRIEEMGINNQNNLVVAVIKKSAELITKGDYFQASQRLNAIVKPNGEPEKTELLAYISLLEAINGSDKKLINDAISLLDPNYSGILSSEINEHVAQYVDLGKWGSIYKVGEEDAIAKGVIRLGMKRPDIIAQLGVPIESKQIKGSYGDFEKLTYDKQVLYFESGVLNTIKRY